MTLRRKIAELLRRSAGAIDDTPRPSRAQTEARVAAIMAIPRSPNRFVEKKNFSNFSGGHSILDDANVLRMADRFDRQTPGLYAENPDMAAAIARYRAGWAG